VMHRPAKLYKYNSRKYAKLMTGGYDFDL
jgi:hypothetical protein